MSTPPEVAVAGAAPNTEAAPLKSPTTLSEPKWLRDWRPYQDAALYLRTLAALAARPRAFCVAWAEGKQIAMTPATFYLISVALQWSVEAFLRNLGGAPAPTRWAQWASVVDSYVSPFFFAVVVHTILRSRWGRRRSFLATLAGLLFALGALAVAETATFMVRRFLLLLGVPALPFEAALPVLLGVTLAGGSRSASPLFRATRCAARSTRPSWAAYRTQRSAGCSRRSLNDLGHDSGRCRRHELWFDRASLGGPDSAVLGSLVRRLSVFNAHRAFVERFPMTTRAATQLELEGSGGAGRPVAQVLKVCR